MKLWAMPALGASFACGCAGPLDQRWDDPVYQTLQDRFSEHDRRVAGDPSQGYGEPVFDVESLGELRVEDAVRIAIANSPRLRGAGYRVDAASGRVLQAGLYPNPSLSFGGEAIGSDAGSGGETAYAIEQEIVLGGRLDRARDVARSDELSARAEFVAMEFAVGARVWRAYFGSLAARERLALRQELADLALGIQESIRAQVQAGAATEPDRLRAEVAYEQAQIELESARYEAHAARRVLSSAMGIELGADVPLVSLMDSVPVLESEDTLAARTLEANGRVSLARIAIVRARQAHRLAKADSAPELVASIGPRFSDIDDESTIDIGLGIEIPLFDRNQGEIRATLAERLSASAELRDVQLELLAEVSEAWSMYQSANSAAGRYQNQLLPKAEKTLDLTRQAYQSGKADYLRLLDAQQVVIESKVSYINTLERLHHAVALLNELSHTHAPWRGPRDEDQPQAEADAR